MVSTGSEVLTDEGLFRARLTEVTADPLFKISIMGLEVMVMLDLGVSVLYYYKRLHYHLALPSAGSVS